ncbi:MAG: hypothetical protein WA840_08345 [Caulobacteraceae bacterium]
MATSLYKANFCGGARRMAGRAMYRKVMRRLYGPQESRANEAGYAAQLRVR